jgi:hypothetical protein
VGLSATGTNLSGNTSASVSFDASAAYQSGVAAGTPSGGDLSITSNGTYTVT